MPANHWQAEDRAYRIGQTRAVNVTYMVAEDTVDLFVRSTLVAKAELIEAVVEGKGGVVPNGDLLRDLEQLISSLSPGIATLSDAESGEDAVDRLLREVCEAVRRGESAAGEESDGTVRSALHQLPEEAVMALARALMSPPVTRYRAASGSKPGESHLLEVSSGDVTCSCRGFEYRGACSHSRSLKAALVTKKPLPATITVKVSDV